MDIRGIGCVVVLGCLLLLPPACFGEGEAYEDPTGVLPRVSGRVLAVAGGQTVELSIGKDDGLRKGHQLAVFRNQHGENRYMGRVEVVNLWPDRAVATILPKYLEGAIRTGDSVSSKID